MNCLQKIYELVKNHDLPNWITFFFSILLWPTFLYFWNKRKHRYIKNLKVSLSPCDITCNNIKVNAIKVTITNSTSSTVMITNMRLKNNTRNFSINKCASRDFYSGYYELKFFDGKDFIIRDMVFYTDKENYTSIGIEDNLSDSIYTYNPNFVRRLFRIYKYFVLEYTVLVGNRRYFVKTSY